MIPTVGETYEFKLYRRIVNSFNFEDVPAATFRGSPVGQKSKKQYRILSGVAGTTDDIFIIATNLPKDIKVGDRIVFLGETKEVRSVGYYFDENLIVNAKLFSNEYIAKRCPKGLTMG